MKKKSLFPAYFAVAFVWFTTHFGGGFASGRQVAEFFVQYGWYSIFTPIIAMGINALVFYYVWDFSVVNNTYDYRSWTNEFYKPYEKIFSNMYEIIFVMTMCIATAVAFATGGDTIATAIGTPYILNTIIIASIIFILTIFGANIVRRVAVFVAVLLIVGVAIVYGVNAIASFPQVIEVINTRTGEAQFWPALWRMLLYASFQSLAIGAYIAVADALKTREDAKKAAITGFIVNGALLTLAAFTVFAHYPDILEIPVPTLTVVNQGIGGSFAEGLISVLIILGVISTGVNFVFGGVKRIVSWWPGEASDERNRSIIVSLGFVLLTWSIALFGLIPLVARGYNLLGYLGIPMIIIPVFYKMIKSKIQ
ncbi:YkvI family membrane protein [Natronospora cellulosivora (SeqCode)]